MRRSLLGVLATLALSALALVAQRMASSKVVQPEVVYVPGTGRTHSFANEGSSKLEILSVELE